MYVPIVVVGKPEKTFISYPRNCTAPFKLTSVFRHVCAKNVRNLKITKRYETPLKKSRNIAIE